MSQWCKYLWSSELWHQLIWKGSWIPCSQFLRIYDMPDLIEISPLDNCKDIGSAKSIFCICNWLLLRWLPPRKWLEAFNEDWDSETYWDTYWSALSLAAALSFCCLRAPTSSKSTNRSSWSFLEYKFCLKTSCESKLTSDS